MEIGTIAHLGKEMVAQAIILGQKPDYAAIRDIVQNGIEKEAERILNDDGEPIKTNANDNRKQKRVLGINELKEKYFFEWVEPDDKSGLTYDQKLDIYFKNLSSMENDEEWKPMSCEEEFDFLYQNKYRLHGFIDKLDKNIKDEIRVVDYKSSKKVFEDKDIKTPLQMFIYTLAVQDKYNTLPVAHLYDFIFINQQQSACSAGYLKRGETKLQKLFANIEESRTSKIYTPKPTPLCHWCDYCKTNPNASDKLKQECPYHSLWTRANKTYEVNMAFKAETQQKVKGFWF